MKNMLEESSYLAEKKPAEYVYDRELIIYYILLNRTVSNA